MDKFEKQLHERGERERDALWYFATWGWAQWVESNQNIGVYEVRITLGQADCLLMIKGVYGDDRKKIGFVGGSDLLSAAGKLIRLARAGEVNFRDDIPRSAS